MDYLHKLIEDIETHSVEGIRECFAHGIDPNDIYNGQPLIYELTGEYLRSPRFKDCVRAFVEHGLAFDDQPLLSVLLDDAPSLRRHLSDNPTIINDRYTLRCAFTPLYEATLLHICAEYNHVACAAVLITHGANVNAVAGVDEKGFGGQTPVYHTVNQNRNNSKDMLDLLLENHAELKHYVVGLVWGKGYHWETLIPAVNPISYAMMGLLPQMHRDETTIHDIVSKLLKAAYGIAYKPTNVPNKYLQQT